MLDNLVNADLSGLVGHISYTYDSMSQVVPGLILGMLFFVILSYFVMKCFEVRATYNYRKKLMDLYVAGTIRKLAKDDNIDLEEEYKTFIKTEKKMKAQQKELDEVVESKLKDEVTEDNQKTIEFK